MNHCIQELNFGRSRNAGNIEMADIGEEEEGRLLQPQVGPSAATVSPRGQKIDRALKPWTLSHAYYANMGGIRVKLGHNRRQADEIDYSYYVTGTMLRDPECPKTLVEAILRHGLSENDIKDKSNSDPLTKSLAILQILWLVLSMIARKARNIALSQLEIVTLAFAVMAVLIYAVCWDHPQNVDEATLVIAPTDESDLARTVDFLKLGRCDSMFGEILKIWGMGLEYPDRVQNDNLMKRVDGYNNTTLWAVAIAVIFGGLHCLAWSFEFPTEAERVIWRCASIASATFPGISVAVILFVPGNIGVLLRFLAYLFTSSTWLLYILARLALLTIAFLSLRSMPEDVYITTWAKYLPNVQ